MNNVFEIKSCYDKQITDTNYNSTSPRLAPTNAPFLCLLFIQDILLLSIKSTFRTLESKGFQAPPPNLSPYLKRAVLCLKDFGLEICIDESFQSFHS